ncbi:hypothetical protein LTR17_022927 [Elasticomyces elasticus]|nr:hypothetical protein LTR17_022927 [Elasticomyces elasticus]
MPKHSDRHLQDRGMRRGNAVEGQKADYRDKCKYNRGYAQKNGKKGAGSKGQTASSTQSGLEMFGFATAQKEETDDDDEDEEDEDEME